MRVPTTDDRGPPPGERPLAGFRLLEAVRGDMAAITTPLAELGADVVRLEPDGTAHDLSWLANNASKRTAPLTAFERLAPGAHAILDDGLLPASDRLLADYPEAVVMRVSPFGETEGFADWQGGDAVYHALSGMLARSGIPGREPLLPPGDLALRCAAAHGAWALIAALYRARQTGRGDYVDFSVFDGAHQALDPGYGIAGSAAAGTPSHLMGRGRPEARMRYPIVRCADGFVRLCILAPRQWRGMFRWMGEPEAFADPKFDSLIVRFQSPELIPAIARFFANKTRAEAEAEGQEHGVPIASVLNFDEALATEQVRARRSFTTLPFEDGAVPMPNGTLVIDEARMGPVQGAIEATGWRDATDPPAPDGDGALPLEGLRVLDFGVIVVGAEVGRLLGDLGADVVKVESAAFPDGLRVNATKFVISPTFVTGHRNKRSAGIDLRHQDGKALILDLVRQADVITTNFRGGVLQSLGLDYESLKAINPGIVVADSSAFGSTGPWAAHKGYGPLVRAWAGLTSEWRYPDDPESFSDAITVYPDHVAGRMNAVGILALLLRRARTGLGGSVGSAQSEIMLSHFAARIAADATGRERPEGAEQRLYACAGDDEWCAVTLPDEKTTARLDALTGGDPKAWFAARPPDTAMRECQQAGVPAGAMLRLDELPEHPYFEARRFFRTESHPLLPEPFAVERTQTASRAIGEPPARPGPQHAQHTREVLSDWLGMDDEAIDALAEAGAIEFAPPESLASPNEE